MFALQAQHVAEHLPRKIIIISAPSGTGKNSLIDELLKRRNNLAYCISTTTRSPRGSEKNGEHYYFCSRQEFQQMIGADGFLEYAEVLGNYYGTSRAEINRLLQSGKYPILDLDVQGAIALKERYPDEVISIFISPPSLEELRKRLLKRGTENPEQIEKRLELAQTELALQNRYDHTLVNDDFETALGELDRLIMSFSAP